MQKGRENGSWCTRVTREERGSVRSDRLLPPHVPYIQLVVFVFKSFDVEAKSRADSIDILSVELLEHSSFPYRFGSNGQAIVRETGDAQKKKKNN